MATAKKRTKKTAAASSAAKKTTGKSAGKKTAAKGKKPTTAPKVTPHKAAAKSTKKGPAKKATAKSSTARKTSPTNTASAAKKSSTAKRTTAAKKASAKKASAKKASAKKASAKKASAKKASAKKASRKARAKADVDYSDVTLFAPLTEGERADALRILTEDPRLARMASVGRYRVIAVEPLCVKPPHGLSGRRLARVVAYDYAADRSVDGCIDLDQHAVAHLSVSRAQPMLAREEEAAAILIAMSDDRVKNQLSLGDEPQVAMHYWSRTDTSISFSRRSAAVIFGPTGSAPTLIAVVDLVDNLVCEIVPATHW